MKVLIKGLNINYQIIGEGKSLLILHGWGSCAERWQRVGELLAEKGLNPVRNSPPRGPSGAQSAGVVSNGVKVIIPDLPGFGESEEPRGVWDLDDYCDFVQEFIDRLGLLNRFYLLGHSFGGALAVKFSLRFPEKINKLFLVGAACIRRKSLKVKLFKFISKFFKIKPLFLRKLFYRKSDYLSVEGIMKETYLKIIREDLSDILSKVQVPTVIIWGKKDNITSIKDARLINYKIKDSRLEILVKTGHNPHLECPEKLADVILNAVKDPDKLPRDSSPTAQNDNMLWQE